MAYTVLKLITAAYNLSGIVSKDFQQVSGSQFASGLDNLNDILGDTTTDMGMIPYYTKVNFNGIVGVEEYFIENLIEIESFTFFIGSVRYSTLKNSRKNYFGSPRAEGIESLPFNWHSERAFIPGIGPAGTVGAGTNLFVYFTPNVAYPFEIWGLFSLAEANFNDDLSLIYDRFYIDYLKYTLAERFCDEYSYVVPPNITDRLQYLTNIIDKASGELDLKQRTISTLDNKINNLNYGNVNLGRGWTTS